MNKVRAVALNQKGLAPILIVILVAATLLSGYFIYQNQSKSTPSQQITQLLPTPDKIEGWKIYRNEQYKFEFQYPYSWQEKYESCCLSVISYEELPNNFDPTQGAASVINSKKEFLEQKSLVDNGNLPPNFAEESRFIKAFRVDSISAIQRFTLSLSSGVYMINTTLFTDKVRVDISQILPVKTLNKVPEGHSDISQMDTEKSIQRLDEIKNGIFNTEIESVVNEHNTVLSTFKFTQ